MKIAPGAGMVKANVDPLAASMSDSSIKSSVATPDGKACKPASGSQYR